MAIPEGYMENAQGNLVPVANIKALDMARHEFVLEAVRKGRELRDQLVRSKREFMGDIAAFVSMSAAEYGVVYGGEKGNVTLLSFDGKYKIVRAMAESITFDERLQAARELINQCLRDWTQGSPEDLRAIIDDAFKMDKDGKLSAGRILGLRRLNIKDERWHEAMEAISDSVQVTGSKAYVRMYERDKNGKYQPIALDMAAV